MLPWRTGPAGSIPAQRGVLERAFNTCGKLKTSILSPLLTLPSLNMLVFEGKAKVLEVNRTRFRLFNASVYVQHWLYNLPAINLGPRLHEIK